MFSRGARQAVAKEADDAEKTKSRVFDVKNTSVLLAIRRKYVNSTLNDKDTHSKTCFRNNQPMPHHPHV